MSVEGWKEVKLGDVCDIQHGFAFKGEFFSDTETEWILITPGNFAIGGGFVGKKLKYYQDVRNFQDRYILEPGDLLITMTDLSKNGDTLGYPLLVPELPNKKFLHNQRIGKVVLKSGEVDKRFLYYLFCTSKYHHSVLATATGSTVKHTAPKRILDLAFQIPSLSEQHRISSVLSLFDQKIELNTQIDQDLEEMAQALFRSWFIDFEPFQEGEFVESELGPIPKGWKVTSLDQIADFTNGLAMQKYRPTGDQAIPVIKIRELSQGFTNSHSDKATPDLNPKYIVNDGDVLFSWSGTLLVKVWCGGVGGLNQHIFKVTSDRYEKWFYYYWLRHHLHRFKRIAEDKATTMGHIKRKDLSESKVVIPDLQSYRKISEIMNKIFQKRINIQLETNGLKTIRDILLPKFMSGEIRV